MQALKQGVREGAEPVRIIHRAPLAVYAYADLQGRAKERAAEWLYQGAAGEGCLDSWSESCQDFLKRVGLKPSKRGDKQALDFNHSLSHCQGDGVAFYGVLDLREWLAADLKDEDPDLVELFWKKRNEVISIEPKTTDFVEAVDLGVRIIRNHFGTYYSHYRTMDVVYDSLAEGYDIQKVQRIVARVEEWVRETSQLMEHAGYEEFEAATNQEALAELARINEYTFDEDGVRAG